MAGREGGRAQLQPTDDDFYDADEDVNAGGDQESVQRAGVVVVSAAAAVPTLLLAVLEHEGDDEHQQGVDADDAASNHTEDPTRRIRLRVKCDGCANIITSSIHPSRTALKDTTHCK